MHIPLLRIVTLCWAFVVLVCVDASQRIPLSALVRNPHKGPERETSASPEVDEGRKVPEKTERVSWQRRPEEGSQQKVPGEDCLEIRVGYRGDQSTEVRKTTYRNRVNQREKMSALLVALWEFSLGYTFALAHRMHKNVTSPFLRLELTQARAYSFVLFFHPLGCVLCVRKEMCNALVGDERNHKTILMTMSSLVGWDCGGRPVRGIGTVWSSLNFLHSSKSWHSWLSRVLTYLLLAPFSCIHLFD